MSNSEVSHSIPYKAMEISTTVAAPVIGPAVVLQELDSNDRVSIPWVNEIPGIDHASSMGGSILAGIVAIGAVEQIARRLDTSGKEKTAETVRRAGTAVAWVGSVACHLAIEMNSRGGVSDKWDFIAGLTTIGPGIIAGRFITPSHRPYKKSGTPHRKD